MPNKLINKQKKKYLITPALYFNYSIWRFSLLFYIKFNSKIIKNGKKKECRSSHYFVGAYFGHFTRSNAFWKSIRDRIECLATDKIAVCEILKWYYSH